MIKRKIKFLLNLALKHRDLVFFFYSKLIYECRNVWNWYRVRVMVFDATFNTISVISWWSVLLVAESGGPRENYRPVASHWQTLSHNVVHLALIEIRTHISRIHYWKHFYCTTCHIGNLMQWHNFICVKA